MSADRELDDDASEAAARLARAGENLAEDSDTEAPKFDIDVQLTGTDGNTIMLMMRVVRALRAAGASRGETDEYETEALAGDYSHFFDVTRKWVNIS